MHVKRQLKTINKIEEKKNNSHSLIIGPGFIREGVLGQVMLIEDQIFWKLRVDAYLFYKHNIRVFLKTQILC